MPATVFRMSCIYGRHQHGNEDQGWVAHFLVSLLAGRPLTIYGDGAQVRDVLHADDLVEAMLGARAQIGECAGRAFNVGGGPGNAISLLELLVQMEELHGGLPDVTFAPTRAGRSSLVRLGHAARASRTLGWKPAIDSGEGIASLYEWLGRNRLAAAERLAVTAASLTARAQRDRCAGPHRAGLAGGARAGRRARSLVRLEGCGVCASSLPLWEGRPWFTYPRDPGEPGHEGWGRVEEAGAGADALAAGLRVAVLSFHGFARARGSCRPRRACRFRASSTICRSRRGVRLRVQRRRARAHRAGAAGRDRRDGLPGAAAWRGDLPAPRGRGRARAARRRGRGAVRAGDRGRRHAGVARRRLAAGRGRRPARDRRLPPGRPAHGRPAELELARESTSSTPTSDRRHASAPACAGAARLAAAGVLDVERLCTHVFPPTRLADAFEAARVRPAGFVKALVCAVTGRPPTLPRLGFLGAGWIGRRRMDALRRGGAG